MFISLAKRYSNVNGFLCFPSNSQSGIKDHIFVSYVVYEGNCNFGKIDISEIGQNVTIRWDEHSDIGKSQSQKSNFINSLNTDLIEKFFKKFWKVRQTKIHDDIPVLFN